MSNGGWPSASRMACSIWITAQSSRRNSRSGPAALEGNGSFASRCRTTSSPVCLLHHFDVTAVEQIQAISQINDRPDDRRPADFRLAPPRADLQRELERPLCVVLPKVNAVAKPVVIILAGGEGCLAREDLLRHGRIATVIAEDEGCGSWVQVR